MNIVWCVCTNQFFCNWNLQGYLTWVTEIRNSCSSHRKWCPSRDFEVWIGEYWGRYFQEVVRVSHVKHTRFIFIFQLMLYLKTSNSMYSFLSTSWLDICCYQSLHWLPPSICTFGMIWRQIRHDSLSLISLKHRVMCN